MSVSLSLTSFMMNPVEFHVHFQPSSPRSHMYRNDPLGRSLQTTHQILSPLDSTLPGLTHKPCVVTHSLPLHKLLLCPQSALCTPLYGGRKKQFNHQLPTRPSTKSPRCLLLVCKPLWKTPIPHSSESSELWHSNCLFTGLLLDCELLRAGGQSCPLSPLSTQPRAWSTVAVQ